MTQDHLTVYETLTGVHKVKIIVTTLKCYLPFSLCWHLHQWSNNNDLTAVGNLVWIKQWQKTHIRTLLHSSSSLFKNIFDEAVKVTNFFKSWLSSTHLLTILWDEKGSTQKVLLLYWNNACLKEKQLRECFKLQAEFSKHFFHRLLEKYIYPN